MIWYFIWHGNDKGRTLVKLWAHKRCHSHGWNMGCELRVQCSAVITHSIFSKILTKPRARCGVSFVGQNSDIYSASVTEVVYAVSCYIGLRYNGTQVTWGKIDRYWVCCGCWLPGLELTKDDTYITNRELWGVCRNKDDISNRGAMGCL